MLSSRKVWSTPIVAFFMGLLSASVHHPFTKYFLQGEELFNAKVAAETKAYQKIPEVLSFTDANGNDTTKEQVEANYRQIKLDVVEIIEREKERIANDPKLRHLVEKEGEYS